MSKIVCVLYDDPVDGYPKSYARDDLPKLTGYPDGQTLPSPKKIDFIPVSCSAACPASLGCASFSKSKGTSLS